MIDLGPGVEDGAQPQRGDKGGEIVAEGTPEDVAQVARSYTGPYLKLLLSPQSLGSGEAEGRAAPEKRNC